MGPPSTLHTELYAYPAYPATNILDKVDIHFHNKDANIIITINTDTFNDVNVHNDSGKLQEKQSI